ncbi:hypothetical protein Fcan01_26813 [Folsomia candida]|uniref:Uncharacterized protein n=1 Tax=Folsomia candida TaxID=158441 RepID=A0A226D221_FOLCA|nr:hypothetical protein Fcan01_26813 [Folsomia candida]
MGAKAIKIFIYLVEVVAFVYPILLFLLLRFVPCKPPFILSMVATCRRVEAVWIRHGVGLGVHIFEAWMGCHIIYSGTALIVYVLTAKNINSGEISKIRSGIDITSCIRIYRYIQTLEKSFNAVVTRRIVPTIIFCIPVIQIFALFVCITYRGEISLPGFAIFPLLAICAGINNALVISLPSMVNISSQRVINALIQNTVGSQVGRKRSLLLKELRSCGLWRPEN